MDVSLMHDDNDDDSIQDHEEKEEDEEDDEIEEVQDALYIAPVHAEADKDGNMHETW